MAFGVDSGIGTNPPETAREGDQRAYFYLSTPYEQSIHQSVYIPSGTYRFEFWARLYNVPPNTARGEIEIGSTTSYIDISESSEWVHYISEPIESNGETINVGFYVDSPGGTTLLIDGVRLLSSN